MCGKPNFWWVHLRGCCDKSEGFEGFWKERFLWLKSFLSRGLFEIRIDHFLLDRGLFLRQCHILHSRRVFYFRRPHFLDHFFTFTITLFIFCRLTLKIKVDFSLSRKTNTFPLTLFQKSSPPTPTQAQPLFITKDHNQ